MTAPEIINYLGQGGYRVGYNAVDGVKVTPEPSARIAKRLATLDAEMRRYLSSLENAPASGHAFYAEESADLDRVQDFGVCIACGIPWRMHGEPARGSWVLVKAACSVELIVASPIEIEERSAA